MSLISPLPKTDANPQVKEKLENIEEAFGMLPNIIGVMARSEATLDTVSYTHLTLPTKA